ncbi:replication initiation protein [Lactococcus lactis]|uniref:RepB family plasmid replication initiator protein n=1 Tax=Lactococcus lactis TaxID=1358 RepID=A0A6M0M717_9LACT|nr:replication initiation protein [Lactococcus lactis]NEX48837.1 RepB family plasmid replication initiator protein [Lactococcus lactis]NEX55250.1 RepB family plasmid replication initiator protein [Lactococcus lactis]
MTHEIVQYHNDFNTVPLRGFNEREKRIIMTLLHEVKGKDTQVVQLDFQTLRGLSGWDDTKHKGANSNAEFVKYLEVLSDKIMTLRGTLRSEDGLQVVKFSLFPTFIIDGKKTNNLKVSINPEFKYLTNLFDMFTAFELEDYNRMSTSYGQELYRLIKQFRTTGFYRVKTEDLRHLLSVPKSYSNADMDRKVFSKTTVTDLSNAFKNFKIKQERGAGRGRPIIGYTFTFDKEKANQYEIDREKEEKIAQFWKSDEPAPMPKAIAQTEYQNPELRKENEEIEKHGNIFGDLLKGWFKGE